MTNEKANQYVWEVVAWSSTNHGDQSGHKSRSISHPRIFITVKIKENLSDTNTFPLELHFPLERPDFVDFVAV